jgi:Abortive infection alpha
VSDEARDRAGQPGLPVPLEPVEPPRLGDFLRAGPGLARVAVDAGLHGAVRMADAYATTLLRATEAVARGEPTGQVVQELTAELRAYVRDLLGLSEGRTQPGGNAPLRARRFRAEEASREALRLRGSELLRRSADVSLEDDSHPAYMRILESLAPDEARILRFLARNGPQPSVDVRAGLPLVSELVAPGCSMIAAEAGCRHPDFAHPYMDNLHRLGLVWFSREPVRDPRRYQVLEAQPEVMEARGKGGRLSRTVRRSILLTPFGEDFCDVCLPLDEIDLDEPSGPSA